MYSHHSANGSNVAGTPKYKLQDVLVEINGWRLVKPLYPNLIDCNSYIVHIDCRREMRSTVQQINKAADKCCTYCGKSPPEEIVGLEILHNGKI